MSDFVVEEARTGLPIFIHSEIDDLGLTPFEFRAYAHLARRVNDRGGTYWESVEEGARTCRMNVKTYRAALSGLASLGLITREERAGQTSVYRLNPTSDWKTPTKSGRGTESGRGDPYQIREGTPTKSGRGPLPNQVDKGTPKKVLPEGTPREPRARKQKRAKKPQAFKPEHVPLPDFVSPDVWTDFVGHRNDLRKPLTPRAIELILADLAKTPLDADEMLRTSIKRGWTGVFALNQLRKPRDPTTTPALDQYTKRGL